MDSHFHPPSPRLAEETQKKTFSDHPRRAHVLMLWIIISSGFSLNRVLNLNHHLEDDGDTAKFSRTVRFYLPGLSRLRFQTIILTLEAWAVNQSVMVENADTNNDGRRRSVTTWDPALFELTWSFNRAIVHGTSGVEAFDRYGEMVEGRFGPLPIRGTYDGRGAFRDEGSDAGDDWGSIYGEEVEEEKSSSLLAGYKIGGVQASDLHDMVVSYVAPAANLGYIGFHLGLRYLNPKLSTAVTCKLSLLSDSCGWSWVYQLSFYCAIVGSYAFFIGDWLWSRLTTAFGG